MILDPQYREMDALSNSRIKFFLYNSPKLYYDKFVNPLHPTEVEFSTESTDIGDLVDCYTTTPDLFDKFYYISGDVKCSNDMKAILTKAYQRIQHTEAETLDDKRKRNARLTDISLVSDIAVEIAREHMTIDIKTGEEKKGYRGNYGDDALSNLFIKEGKSFYEDLGTANGRKILDMTTDTKAKNAKAALYDDPFTGPILDTKATKDISIHRQWMVTAIIDKMHCKILIDFAIRDSKNMIIYPKDIKTTFSHKQFMINYKSLLYGLQGAFYEGVLQRAFPKYKIAPFEYLVVTTNSGEAPLKYRLMREEKDDYTKVWLKALDDIKWHNDNGLWAYPREYYENNYIPLNTGITPSELQSSLGVDDLF